MSDLVRRVAYRLRCEQTLKRNDEEQTRAAIREVASWLKDQPTPLSTDPFGCAIEDLLKQLEEPK